MFWPTYLRHCGSFTNSKTWVMTSTNMHAQIELRTCRMLMKSIYVLWFPIMYTQNNTTKNSIQNSKNTNYLPRCSVWARGWIYPSSYLNTISNTHRYTLIFLLYHVYIYIEHFSTWTWFSSSPLRHFTLANTSGAMIRHTQNRQSLQ